MEQVWQFTRLPCLQIPVRTHLSITHPLSESGRRFSVTDLEGSFVTNIDSLSAHYAKPTERVLKKRLDHVNAWPRVHCRLAVSGSRHRKPGRLRLFAEGRSAWVRGGCG